VEEGFFPIHTSTAIETSKLSESVAFYYKNIQKRPIRRKMDADNHDEKCRTSEGIRQIRRVPGFIRLNYSERGCRLATVCVGRRVAAFNHQLRSNAEAVLMLSTLL
jgi:hypothetical protein